MNRRTLLVVLAVLVVVGAWSFTAAELWIAPGHPTPGHQSISGDCFACHRPLRGTPADRCVTCHIFKPSTRVSLNGKVQPGTAFFALHRDAAAHGCTNCHTGHLTRENPTATPRFDHRAFFPLDPPHNAACKTCHLVNDFKQYTCTGCHEHSPDRLAREHAEEGIRNIDNCIRCHRSGREHDQYGQD